MHPVIQLTVAVAVLIIAIRAWPPTLYWLAGILISIALVKVIRRSLRAINKAREGFLCPLIFFCMGRAGFYS